MQPEELVVQEIFILWQETSFNSDNEQQLINCPNKLRTLSLLQDYHMNYSDTGKVLIFEESACTSYNLATQPFIRQEVSAAEENIPQRLHHWRLKRMKADQDTEWCKPRAINSGFQLRGKMWALNCSKRPTCNLRFCSGFMTFDSMYLMVPHRCREIAIRATADAMIFTITL